MPFDVRVLVLVVAAFLPGCITLAGDQLTDLEPRRAANAPAIEQTVGDFSFHLDGGKMVTSNKMGRSLNDVILERWQNEGYIAGDTYVKSGNFTDASTFRLTLSGHHEGESSIFLQIISGLTLTVIPYSVDSQMALVYSLRNAETGCVFEASATDSYRTIVGLLMLPATPFAQGGRIRTFRRLADTLYDGLSTQGAFDPQAPCPGASADRPGE